MRVLGSRLSISSTNYNLQKGGRHKAALVSVLSTIPDACGDYLGRIAPGSLLKSVGATAITAVSSLIEARRDNGLWVWKTEQNSPD